jgi:hypothetical protein
MTTVSEIILEANTHLLELKTQTNNLINIISPSLTGNSVTSLNEICDRARDFFEPVIMNFTEPFSYDGFLEQYNNFRIDLIVMTNTISSRLDQTSSRYRSNVDHISEYNETMLFKLSSLQLAVYDMNSVRRRQRERQQQNETLNNNQNEEQKNEQNDILPIGIQDSELPEQFQAIGVYEDEESNYSSDESEYDEVEVDRQVEEVESWEQEVESWEQDSDNGNIQNVMPLNSNSTESNESDSESDSEYEDDYEHVSPLDL